MPMDALAVLAEPTRRRIADRLRAADSSVGDLVTALRMSQPAISKHLKVLREAGVVVSERRGSWIFYRLAPNVAQRLDGIARGLVPGGLIPVGELTRRRPAQTAKPASA